jgi:hypothetical protein
MLKALCNLMGLSLEYRGPDNLTVADVDKEKPRFSGLMKFEENTDRNQRAINRTARISEEFRQVSSLKASMQ